MRGSERDEGCGGRGWWWEDGGGSAGEVLLSCGLSPVQVVHLDKDEEMQKLPLQPPYYDMAPSDSAPFTDKPVSSDAPGGLQSRKET